MNSFKTIETRNELADFLGISRSKLTHILYVRKPENYYSSFDIPKKSGGVRTISAPSGTLKRVQKNIANRLYEYRIQLWEKTGVHPNLSHAFEKKKSIISNAKIHRNKRYVLNLDLEDFFGSIHFGRVCGYFEKNHNFQMPHNLAVVMALLCCYNGKLPQGASTSPIITNFICEAFDFRVLRIAKKYKLDYTRYADDLSFSTNDKSFIEKYTSFMEEIEKEVQHAGFQINTAKTRLQYRDSRQSVTGITVNKKLSVDKKYYKLTRAMADTLYKTGEFSINNQPGTLEQLNGRFAFINQLDKYNNKNSLDSKSSMWDLNSREIQYQKFLFYRYFYANPQPLIVTEGKTDILYLKAAMMHFYRKYPSLISKKNENTFEFKISFLRKSPRLKYFFGISQDGADALQNIYKFYVGDKGKRTAYFEIFSKLRTLDKQNPVILLFDNELNDKNRPISKFINSLKNKDEFRKRFEKTHNEKIIGNLFLITHPLITGKAVCEIEDLFDDKTRAHIIDGKKFSPSDKYNPKTEYGKDTFSKFVFANYSSINFSNFIPLLDAIQDCLVKHPELVSL